MNADIEALAALAPLDEAWVAATAALAALPSRLAAVKQRALTARKAAEAAAAELEAIRRERREKESEARDGEATAARLSAQLPQMKSPEAYAARTHELELLQAKVSALETAILVLLEREEAQGPLAEKKAAAAAAEAETAAAETAGLEEARGRQEGIKAELDTARAGLVAGLGPQLRAKYERIFQSRHGHAIARVPGGACGACHAALPPQGVSDVRKGEVVQVCEACGRLLIAGGA